MIIAPAHAAEAAGEAAGHGAFYTDPTFWVAVGFLLFLALLWRMGVHRQIAEGLDERAAKIKAQLDEAARLRADAERLLAEAEACGAPARPKIALRRPNARPRRSCAPRRPTLPPAPPRRPSPARRMPVCRQRWPTAPSPTWRAGSTRLRRLRALTRGAPFAQACASTAGGTASWSAAAPPSSAAASARDISRPRHGSQPASRASSRCRSTGPGGIQPPVSAA
jgi:hypothetical protein